MRFSGAFVGIGAGKPCSSPACVARASEATTGIGAARLLVAIVRATCTLIDIRTFSAHRLVVASVARAGVVVIAVIERTTCTARQTAHSESKGDVVLACMPICARHVSK